jgi:hypothetical protein
MVVKRHRHLDQPLEKLPLRPKRGSPNVFQRLVRLEEFTLIE